jgi:PAS domain S-box-containing protein/putative nucleotidyltransferase with HDIG domain
MKDRTQRSREPGASHDAVAPDGASPSVHAVAPSGTSPSVHAVAPSVEYLAEVVRSAQDAIFTTDRESRITSWNTGAERLYGYLPDEVVGQNVSILAGFRNSQEVKDILEHLLRGERVERLRAERRHRDGRILFVSIVISPVRSSDGAIVGASTIARDVSKERETEERLLQLNRRAEQQALLLDMVLRSTPDMLVLFDADGRLMFASESALRVMGASLEDVYGKTVAEFGVHGEAYAELEAARSAVMETGVETTGEVAMPTPDGTVEFTYTVSPAHGAGGSISGAVATLRDDTAQKAIEAVLRQEKEFTDAIVEAAPGIFFTTDRDGRVVRWNAFAERFFDVPSHGLAGLDALELVAEEDRPLGAAAVRDAMETGSGVTQLRFEGAEGIRDSLVTLRRADIAGVPYIVGFGVDVTDRVEAEAEMIVARQQLESRVAERTSDLQAANTRLRRSERALLTLSWSNQALAQAVDPDQLLRDVCTAAVEIGGYVMAWVGRVEDDGTKTVRPIARSGRDEGFLDSVVFSWGAGPEGQGTVGRCVRASAPAVVSDVENDPSYAPWRVAALERGYRSALSLPLTDPHGETWGVFCFFAGEPDAFVDREIALLEELAMDLSFGVENLSVRAKREEAESELRDSYVRLEHMMGDTVSALGRIVEARDPYTQGHERRVSEIAKALAREMGFDDDAIAAVEMAALLHDIGKLAVPAEILTKPGTLSGSEFDMIKDHSRQGYEILKEITFPWPIADIVLQHHERMDGSGYPSGLKGDQILMPARILAVADVVEAMASHRPYRPLIGLAQAMEFVHDGTDKFDPEVVTACETLYARGDLRL